jgi:hypothetical protein
LRGFIVEREVWYGRNIREEVQKSKLAAILGHIGWRADVQIQEEFA